MVNSTYAAAAALIYSVVTIPVNPPGTSVNLTSAQVWKGPHTKTVNATLLFPSINSFDLKQLGPNDYDIHYHTANGTFGENIAETPPVAALTTLTTYGPEWTINRFVSASANRNPYDISPVLHSNPFLMGLSKGPRRRTQP
ncbi:hypothetical protein PWT90_03503 [Aphanocladium album]|nr:hypothetical protein PWT90_03503 [Aphanocladium album]